MSQIAQVNVERATSTLVDARRTFAIVQDITPLRRAEEQLLASEARFRMYVACAEAERARLEERLRQAEKMQAIGRCASGIAHDFNSVLGGILAYAEMLFDEAPGNTPQKRHAQNVLTAAKRGRDLVGQILAYTRCQRGKRVPTDACRTVAEALELIRSSLPPGIALEPAIPDVPLVVMGDATQIHQVVMNLCSNSIHAMKAGGPLRVAVMPVDAGTELKLSHGALKRGRYVGVRVEDRGCGMDGETVARIFEPFFTTKDFGRGTGLGLALVYAIVTEIGGVIDVETAPGEGSTFTVYIPMADHA
ncbi:MAG TPA: ATP-binding protein [Burkholderiales bacterium]|nr:ATP-binding protein [Burkholderiales bacterium]HUP09004.1 ATP-binding protein [Caldimonas sp.]